MIDRVPQDVDRTVHCRLAVRAVRPRRGFTLVELLVAAGVLSVLMLALTGVIGVVSRAIPSNDDPAVHAALLRRVADMIAMDAGTASSVTMTGKDSWVFVLAGRGPHGEDMTVEYAWSGEPGTPLTRTVDGSDPQVLLAAADEFLMAFSTETRERRVQGAAVESAERLIAQCTEYPATELRLSSLQAVSHFVLPRFPSSVESWRPTRLVVMARSEGSASGSTSVRIFRANAQDLPGSTQIASATLSESHLSQNMAWFSIHFPSAGTVLPEQGICIVLAHASDTHSCALAAVDGSVMDSQALLAVSTTGGLSWTAVPDASLVYELYGVVRERQTQTQSITVATGGTVRVEMRGHHAQASFRIASGAEVQ
jgi:prepilin-type N-terminal cleavage/methylation domain-containing protein